MKAKCKIMGLRILVLAGALAMIGAGEGRCSAGSYELSGTWKFKTVKNFSKDYLSPDYNDFDWGQTQVPGQWQRIPGLHSYHGRAVYRLVRDFKTNTRRFRYHLRFNGIFYKARVFLNGEKLGEHEGYYEPFEFEITDMLEDKNVLVVEVECLREKEVTRKKQVLGVFGNWDAIAHKRNVGGIWAPVQIRRTGKAWIDSVKLAAIEVSPSIRTRLQVGFKGDLPPSAKLDLLFEPDNFQGDSISVSVPIAGRSLDQELSIPGAKIWHPHKRGFPHCYMVTLTLKDNKTVLDKTKFLTGFRTVRVEDDFHFFINGEPLYVKGNNYAPSLVYLSEVTRELVELDVKMIKAANYDMVRVHAHVDHPEFYNACDRGGVLVWQDGPFQWGYDPGIIEEAAAQTGAMVRLLYNHPCIAIWTCHNEPAAVGFDRTRPNPVDILRSALPLANMFMGQNETDWNYDVLDAALVQAVKAEDPYRPVNRASGPKEHDWHNYFGWYIGETDDLAPWLEKMSVDNPKKMRFTTEFGAQAFPAYESAIKFMPPDLKQVVGRQKRRLHLENCWQPFFMSLHTKPRDYQDLASYIEATQDYQSRVQKYHIERIRMTKYQPNYGCITFLHNDSQPAITWSVVDVWRVPKKAYYTIAGCFRDPYVMMPFKFAPYKKGETVTFVVYVANDTLKEYRGVVVKVVSDQIDLEFSADLLPDMKPLEVGSFTWRAAGPGTDEIKLVLSGAGFPEVVNNYELMVK